MNIADKVAVTYEINNLINVIILDPYRDYFFSAHCFVGNKIDVLWGLKIFGLWSAAEPCVWIKNSDFLYTGRLNGFIKKEKIQ